MEFDDTIDKLNTEQELDEMLLTEENPMLQENDAEEESDDLLGS